MAGVEEESPPIDRRLTAVGRKPSPVTTDGSAVVTAASVEAPNGVADFGEFSQDRVDENVEYEQDPPDGGAHFRAWQTCDFHEAPIPNEQSVHSMEHCAVWITFAPDLADDERTAIETLADATREVRAEDRGGEAERVRRQARRCVWSTKDSPSSTTPASGMPCRVHRPSFRVDGEAEASSPSRH